MRLPALLHGGCTGLSLLKIMGTMLGVPQSEKVATCVEGFTQGLLNTWEHLRIVLKRTVSLAKLWL